MLKLAWKYMKYYRSQTLAIFASIVLTATLLSGISSLIYSSQKSDLSNSKTIYGDWQYYIETDRVTFQSVQSGEQGDGYVLEGGLLPDKYVYSEKEVGFLTGSWSDVYDLTRCETVSPDGGPLTVVFQLPKYSDAYYQNTFAMAGRLWLLAIPLYLLATLLFVTLLNRHFRRLLQP